MRLYVFVTCLIPRAVTATRPLPGANIKTCRYAAAWRYAPFLCGGFDAGDRVAAISAANIRTCRYAAAWRYAPFFCGGISWVIESQLRSSELWVLLRYPGLRPLRGLCPGLTFGLAATRLPGAMRLFFCGGFHGWWSRCYTLWKAHLIPRAATATRPLPEANIRTCRYAAARRYAPFLLWRR
jgi:hypothetical protein